MQRASYEAVYQQIDPQTGDRLGRARGRYRAFADHLARLTAAEPHATTERLIELERQAAQATRQPAAYTDVTVSFSKSISVVRDIADSANVQMIRTPCRPMREPRRDLTRPCWTAPWPAIAGYPARDRMTWTAPIEPVATRTDEPTPLTML